MKDRLIAILNLENIVGLDRFVHIMTLLGIMMMVIIYRITDAPRLSLISGAFGIISVLLCSSKKIAFYFFGFVQLITYVILCVQQRLYGEIAENVFYFVTMVWGLYHWLKHYNYDFAEVETRTLNAGQKTWVLIVTVLLTLVMFNILLVTDDTQPFMDAVTTAPAFVAQILSIARYRDSWIYWLVIDVGAIPMWAVAGDWCMVAQYVFWTINCIYGFKKW